MTVEQAADQTCDTGTAKGLSDQIIEVLLDQHPGVMVKVTDSRLWYEGRVNMILQDCARDSLVAALNAGGRDMEIISAYRTVAQQVMLYTWYRRGECGITLASQPGDSNHEDGAALDIGDTDFWRPYLTGRGWNWQGSNDPAHYSYRGSGFNNGVGSWGLMAFQTLWNENNPNDLLEVDGQYGGATERALLASPVEGWPMQRIRTFINGVDQSAAVKAYLHEGNSLLDASDWQGYARSPAPVFDNDPVGDYAGTLRLETYKTTCQVYVDGLPCGKPAQGAVMVSIGGQGLAVSSSLCADHAQATELPDEGEDGFIGAEDLERMQEPTEAQPEAKPEQKDKGK